MSKTLIPKSYDHPEFNVFEKIGFRPHQTRNRRFQILRFEERFEKLHFRGGLVWTVDVVVEKKAAFSSFARKMWLFRVCLDISLKSAVGS